MDKKFFRSIPILEANSMQKEFASQLAHTKIKYFIVTEKINNTNTIILNIFCNSELEEVDYRIFINKNDYITQDFDLGVMKWKTGSFDKILNECFWNGGSSWYESSVLVGTESSNILKDFFDVEDEKRANYFQKIYLLQYEIKNKRLMKKHQDIKDRIDKEMKKIPALPNGFKRWIDKTGLYKSRYIYYEYKARKVLDGYCTNCRKNVRVEGARHNKKGICPNCSSPITFKASGKSKNIIDYGQVALLQRYKDELILRNFTVSKDYRYDYRNPTLTYKEVVRHFISKDIKQKSYEFGQFKQTYETRWRDSLNFYNMSYSVLFTRNLDKILKGTRWEYAALKEFANYEKGYTFSIINYLKAYLKVPALEYFVKMKLYNLSESIIYFEYKYKDGININGKNVFEILNVDNEQLNIVKNINPTLKGLEIMKKLFATNVKFEKEDIEFISEHLRVENVIKMLEYTSYNKIIKYIKSQYKGGKDYGYILSDWVDYIYDCNLLKYNLENTLILFPKSLNDKHREIQGLVENNKVDLLNERFHELYNTFVNTFGWSYKDYLIMPPKSFEEMIEEGNSLNHCVGGQIYADKVIKGESVILFIRKKKEKEAPFYTLELDAKTYELVQCRGEYNKSMTDEVKAIVDKYSDKKLQRKTRKVA